MIGRPGKRTKSTTWTITLIGIFLIAWAFWLEPAKLTTSSFEIRSSKWSSECSGLEVAILADLHIGSPYYGIEQLQQVVSETNKLDVDLILLAGDFVIQNVLGGSFVEPALIAREVGQLQARLGVYAVLGNHDWWHDARAIIDALKNNGIAVLEDRSLNIIDDNCNFWLAGISDYWEGPHDINQALMDIPSRDNLLVFTHNPDIFDHIPEQVAVTFAGHTHGGQVYIPFIGRPIVPSSFGERFAIGHINENGKHLFVNPGLGTSILPVRFLVPPEPHPP